MVSRNNQYLTYHKSDKYKFLSQQYIYHGLCIFTKLVQLLFDFIEKITI